MPQPSGSVIGREGMAFRLASFEQKDFAKIVRRNGIRLKVWHGGDKPIVQPFVATFSIQNHTYPHNSIATCVH
jgi:hypothetical protein